MKLISLIIIAHQALLAQSVIFPGPGSSSSSSPWGSRTSYTIDHTKVAGSNDLTNFTFPVHLTNAAYADTMNSGLVVNTATCGVNSITCPLDLIVASDSGCTTPLNFEVDSWNHITGEMIFQVLAPAVSHTTDNFPFTICAGNSAIVAFQGGARGAAWASNVAARYSLGNPGGSLTAKDSSATATPNNGTITNAVAGTGILDGAADMGTSQNANISIANAASLDYGQGNFSLSCWYNPASFTTDPSNSPFFIASKAIFDFQGTIAIYQVSATTMGAWIGNQDTGYTVASVSLNNWHSAILTYNGGIGGGTVSLYSDSVASTATLFVVNVDAGGPLKLGAVASNTNKNFKGLIDECQYAVGVAWSQSYVNALYNSVLNPGTFIH